MSSIAQESPSFDLRPLPRPQRHRFVFARFEALAPGEAFEIVNDHDPLGLFYQFSTLVPGLFTWEYRDQGPEQWRVLIGRPADAADVPHVHEAGCGCGGSGGCG